MKPFAEHHAPGCLGGIAQAEELQAGLDGDGHAGDRRGLDDDRGADHGEDVAGDDAEVGEPGDPGGVDVELVADRLDGGAGQPEVGRADQDAEGDHGNPDRGAEGRADGQQHDQAGEAHQDADNPVGDCLELAGVVAGDQAGGQADRDGDGGAEQRGEQRQLRAEQQPAPDVAPGAVRSEDVDGVRGGEGLGDVGEVLVERRQDMGEDGQERRCASRITMATMPSGFLSRRLMTVDRTTVPVWPGVGSGWRRTASGLRFRRNRS